MSAVHPLAVRQPLTRAALALAGFAVGLIALLAASSIAMALALSVLILTAFTLLGSRTGLATRSAPRAASERSDPTNTTVMPTVRLILANGEELAAREVVLPHPDEHRLFLTRLGYVVVNQAGEVIYRL